MATSEGIPSSIDIEFLELNDNPYIIPWQDKSENINLQTFPIKSTNSFTYATYPIRFLSPII